MINFPRFEGAAHRNIKFNVTVRYTFNLDFATNIAVRCTRNFYKKTLITFDIGDK